MIAKLKIKWEDKEQLVELRTLTIGEKNEQLKLAMSIAKKGSILTKVFDDVKYEMLCCLKSITKAPFDLSYESFNELPAPLVEQIFGVYRKLHKVEVPVLVDDE